DDPRIITNVPMQVSSIQYSSDQRIKNRVEDVDVDDLLQRFQHVEMKSYHYTEQWRNVNRISGDPQVRGVIAQQLATIFPEHVDVLKEFELPDKGFKLDNFYQVDKDGLTMDLIGAVQAMFDRYSTSANSPIKRGSMHIAAGDATGSESDGGSALITAGRSASAVGGSFTLSSGPGLGASGAVQLQTAESASTGMLSLSTGTAQAGNSGSVHIASGHAGAGSSGALLVETGNSTVGDG
ncbi:hypothetical protein JKP88DRAFT_138092, partial [Tribonema minus]